MIAKTLKRLNKQAFLEALQVAEHGLSTTRNIIVPDGVVGNVIRWQSRG